MASVTSLGVHHPTGLQHAIEEGILPPNPPPSSYTWEVSISREGGREFEDELLTTDSCVLWSRGGVFRKSFRFDIEKEPVTQALLAYFPASSDSPRGNQQSNGPIQKSDKSALSKALVVFLKTQAHIYFLSGTSHLVHMPFEVESACTAPRGVIIQRKPRVDATPVSLRMPKVTPNSFISPQPSFSSRRSHAQGVTDFSTEGLGNPKVLPLRSSLTLESMWQPPMEAADSHWPRLVCLTDPLLELGLVVTHPDRSGPAKGRKSSTGPHFLSPAEEILHIEAVDVPHVQGMDSDGLNIAVTVNREANMYTVWRLTYLENEDPILGGQKKTKPNPSRRRSSMAPGLASGGATPVHPSTRESFGAPLPGKKTRKGAKADDKDKALDNALSSLDPEKGNDATRRQSRRVSSLLARADLSASHDRATFAEQPLHSEHGGRRAASHGSQRPRKSSGYGGPNFGNLNRSINKHPQPPVDDLLEELRAGGDFEGFHNMGLDDHDFDGLAHEMLFTKIHSVSMDNTNVRYSLSSLPARTQAKVFILPGPPTVTDDQGRAQLLVAIQDPVDKRLQLLTLHLELSEDRTPTKSNIHQPPNSRGLSIIPGEPRRVQSVVDSCKVSDGNEAIMILSEDKRGGRELSLQSPWGKVTTITLPLLFLDNLSSLEYSGSYKASGDTPERRPTGINVLATEIDSICYPNNRGAVDLRDKQGRFHRIRIQLQPSSPQVRKTLDVCRSVLHASYADKMAAGWWHVMQWLQAADHRGLEHPLADMEWSAVVILLLASFLVLGHDSESSLRTLAIEMVEPPAKNKWEAMQLREAPNSSACPPWIRSKGWQWLLDSGASGTPSSRDETVRPLGNFIAVHVGLAKKWIASTGGLLALGFEGYLPTALNTVGNSREAAAWSMLLALHLLVEEQKLNILSSEDSSPSQSDLRAVLCQLARWVGWPRYEALYALGTEGDLSADVSGPCVVTNVAEPASNYCILTWIQAHLTTGRGTEFPTLPQLYAATTRDSPAGSLRKQLWAELTPRTMMFEKFLNLLGSSTNSFDVVVAMHQCGFTREILETLPEAVLTPLQDIISICQPNPPPSWPEDLLAFVGRTDISAVLQPGKTWPALTSDINAPSHVAKWDFRMLCQHLEGLNDHVEDTDATERQSVVRSLFREDRRLNEAQSLLSTVKNRVVRLDPRPEWSEAEYLERQKELVVTVATSTLAISAGRGLLYFGLRHPLLTQKYQIAGFNLTCIVKPVNNTVSVDKTMFPEDKINWAFFHQGVAGGLAISPQAKGIDTSWILYNKPGQDLSNRHAGFLLALGLNGHLKSVAKWVAFKYLTPKHTMTTIGLLLGLAVSYLGTMDSLVTRLLSVHVTRMLPQGSLEINVSKDAQTAGIMGIGLLYCNTQHRRMSEIMLSEIEHVDDGEEEDSFRDESYRLAAGFALGFINLGKGNDLRGLRDLRLTEKLLTIATATKRVELVHVLDRSAAGALMAIALIFMKSEDHIVARKIDVPDTVLQFDYVRPDILLLRTVAKNMILWNEVNPAFKWIRDSLPAEYRQRYRLANVSKLQSRDLPFFSILGGLCLSLGLRFAGSANAKVRDLLIHYLDEFMRIVRLPVSNFDSELARGNASMCLDILALSSASVMAGTGDIAVLRRLRALHGRDDASTTYGSHLAAHIAVGALFLGCGTTTFGTSDLAVAALLVAFYPLLPANVEDNRSHLQAFRHFWVLATEPRCLVAKDFFTSQPLNVPILIHLKPDSPSAVAAASRTASNPSDPEAIVLRRQTPCLVPPLDDVLRIQTDAVSMDYWDLAIVFERSPQLVEGFRRNQTIYLRRRPAHESTFPATLRALGSHAIADVNPADRDPFEWVFNLDSFSHLTRAERGVVLDRLGSSGGGVGEGEGASTVVDTRLVLRSGLDGWSRDRLLGLRLLFEWAERRALFAAGAQVTNPPPSERPAEGLRETLSRGKREKNKGKKSDTKRGKNVAVEEARQETGGPQEQGKLDSSGMGGSWWLRDSVVEELKGKAWLASREW
ncbi:hypothetical protein VTK56DRAFT_3265 [Thermocarpiscus australiensis]